MNRPSQSPDPRPRLSRRVAVLVVTVLVAGIFWATRPALHTIVDVRERAGTGSLQPRDVYAESPYQNVRPGVGYVGDAACARCHREIAEAYSSHPMGRSLAPIGGAAEGARIGADAGLPFESKGVQYNVERREGRVFHKATWRGTDGGVLGEIEAEVRYALGSGTRGITFLIERDGSLFQSPIAWFAHQGRWDISPGYREFTTHPNFERPIQPGCLFCHANQFRPVQGTLNRYEVPIFQGHAIGCERCHGPGALHVNRNEPSDQTDLTIVNPANLTPTLRDSVCQQCHLQGTFRFTRAGREAARLPPGPADPSVLGFLHEEAREPRQVRGGRARRADGVESLFPRQRRPARLHLVSRPAPSAVAVDKDRLLPGALPGVPRPKGLRPAGGRAASPGAG